MNDKLQNELATLLESVRAGTVGVRGFVEAEAPEVVREIVAYARFQSTAWTVGFLLAALLLLLFAFWANARFHRCVKDGISAFEDEAGALAVASLVSFVVSGVMFLCAAFSLGNLYCAWFTPRLYILEYVRQALGH